MNLTLNFVEIHYIHSIVSDVVADDSRFAKIVVVAINTAELHQAVSYSDGMLNTLR